MEPVKLAEMFYNNRLHPQAALASEKLLKLGLSVEGLNAILAHTNPFPDKPIEKFTVPQGGKNVVITVVRDQRSIIKPSGLTAGKKWGVAIIEHPILFGAIPPVTYNYTPGQSPTTTTPGSPLTSFFSAFAFDDDAAVIDLVGQTVSGGLSAPLTIGFDTAKIPGTRNLKVIAQGLEVENTTEELYRGGSVTAARFDIVKERTTLTRTIGGNPTPEPVNWFSSWPYRFTDVAGNPNAVSWDAKDGIYMPNTLRKQEPLEFRFIDFSTYVIARTTPNIVQTPVQSLAWGANNGCMDSGYSCKVAVFRGLAEQTSLLLNTILYLEAQQDSSDPLFPLSISESAADPMFDKFLSEVSDAMPVATVFKGNALGSWFTSICDAVTMVADGVADFLPAPFKSVARGVGHVARWAGNFNAGFKQQEASNFAAVPASAAASPRDAKVTVRPGDQVFVKGTGRSFQVRGNKKKKHVAPKGGKKGYYFPAKKGPAKGPNKDKK